MITDEQVSHVAKLAKLSLSDDELKARTQDLNDTLALAESLQKVDTDDVVETSQVTGLTNVLRPDEVIVSESDELLDASAFPQKDHSIKIPRVI